MLLVDKGFSELLQETSALFAYTQKPQLIAHVDLSRGDRGLTIGLNFIHFFHTYVTKLRICADSPDSLLHTQVMSTFNSCPGTYLYGSDNLPSKYSLRL